MRILIAALIVCAAAGSLAAAQQPPSPAPPPPAAQQPPAPTPQTPGPGQPPSAPPADSKQPSAAPPTGRVFTGDAGLIFFPVKTERTGDFEKIMAKLKEAMQASEDPVRREQAAGWKVFKAAEPGPNNTALYVFLIDPAVKGSDYAFWKALYDAFPAEVQQLYRLYTAASAGGQSLLNLTLLQDFSTAPPPR